MLILLSSSRVCSGRSSPVAPDIMAHAGGARSCGRLEPNDSRSSRTATWCAQKGSPHDTTCHTLVSVMLWYCLTYGICLPGEQKQLTLGPWPIDFHLDSQARSAHVSDTKFWNTSLFMFVSLSSLSQAKATTFPPEGRKISWGWNRLKGWKLFRNVAGFLWSENLLLPVTAWVASSPSRWWHQKEKHPIFSHAESVAAWTRFTTYRLKKTHKL